MFDAVKDAVKSWLPKQIKVPSKKIQSDPVERIIVRKVPLDKDEDLNHQMVQKFLESINELVENSQKAKVDLQIEFKDSLLTCATVGGVIALRSIRPKDSDNFQEVAFFSNNAFPLREYLNDNVRCNEDIVELEKTMIRLL